MKALLKVAAKAALSAAAKVLSAEAKKRLEGWLRAKGL